MLSLFSCSSYYLYIGRIRARIVKHLGGSYSRNVVSHFLDFHFRKRIPDLQRFEMSWRRSLCSLPKIDKSSREISKKIGSSLHIGTRNHQDYYVFRAEKIGILAGLMSRRALDSQESYLAARNSNSWGFRSNQSSLIQSRQFGKIAPSDSQLDRDFLVQLWLSDRKTKESARKRSKKLVYGNRGSSTCDNRLFSGASAAEETSVEDGKALLQQPPLSQSASGYLKPESPEEALVTPLLARSNLLITRDIEWANLVLGFEQENRYAIVDVCYPKSPVGFIREQSNVLARQLLRLRRPFVASITDARGNELFRVRRPFWWITSSIYAEVNGMEVGVVHRRWHLWRRIYDLYLGNKQFAVVENPGFWNWTFTLKDIDGNVLAEIDRDWRGFGFELFTDAGQYVIRFGSSDPRSKTGPATAVQDLEVARPLTVSERAVTVALAISLDNDYFSRHGGWGLPLIAVGE